MTPRFEELYPTLAKSKWKPSKLNCVNMYVLFGNLFSMSSNEFKRIVKDIYYTYICVYIKYIYIYMYDISVEFIWSPLGWNASWRWSVSCPPFPGSTTCARHIASTGGFRDCFQRVLPILESEIPHIHTADEVLIEFRCEVWGARRILW